MVGKLTLLLTFYSLLSTVLAEWHVPATLLKRSELKPRINKPLLEKREFEANPLHRLLFARQISGCPAGSVTCTSADGCCDAGQFCYGVGCCNSGDFGCSGNSCCPTGANCCSGGGCCADTDVCVVSDGQPGCCPIGEVCSGPPTGCSLPGYDPCPGNSFCCPSGDTCTTDATGAPACAGAGGTIAAPGPSSSSGPAASLPPSTTPIASTPPIASTSSTPSVTFKPSSVPAVTPSSSSSRVTGSEHAFTMSFPAPGSGGSNAQNSTVSATDPRISYSGSSWSQSNSCGGSSMKATTAGDSLSFQFVGTAIFLNSVVGSSAGVFSVTVDNNGDIADVDGFSTSASGCQIDWSSFGLSNSLHTITVTFKGASGKANSGSASTAFELSNFIVTTVGGSSSGGSSNTALTSHPSTWQSFIWSVSAIAAAFMW